MNRDNREKHTGKDNHTGRNKQTARYDRQAKTVEIDKRKVNKKRKKTRYKLYYYSNNTD